MRKRRRRPPSHRAERRPIPQLPPAEAICRITRLLVAKKRQLGHDDERIASDLKAAMREALERDTPATKSFDVDGEPILFISSAGIYRLVFAEHGLDRSDQFAQERWFALVEMTLSDALAGVPGGAGGG